MPQIPDPLPRDWRINPHRAEQIRWHSKAGRPLGESSLISRSLLCAELCQAGYLSPVECRQAAEQMGYAATLLDSGDGITGLCFRSETDTIAVCSCGEPSEWSRLEPFLRAEFTLGESVGQVQAKVKQAADRLWPRWEEILESETRRVWFSGHSAGAAIAAVCAARCLVSHIKPEPEQLVTFGCPRVGNRKYVEYAAVAHCRWRLRHDPIPSFPKGRPFVQAPSGRELVIDAHGQIQIPSKWKRRTSGLAGLSSAWKWPIATALQQHALSQYVDALFEVSLEEERAGRPLLSWPL